MVPKAELERGFAVYLGGLLPKREYLALFREIVLDAWKQKQAEAGDLVRAADRRMRELSTRRQRLLDAFVYRQAIDQATYEEEKDKLDEEMALAGMAAHDTKLDEMDVEGVVEFAEHVLLNAARLWQESSLEQKQQLQRVLFPQGVTYAAGGFGTTGTSMIFRMLRVVGRTDETEASPTGFEPVLPA